jgi:hypothetical protein
VKTLIITTALAASIGSLALSAQSQGSKSQQNNVVPSMERTSATGGSLGTVSLPHAVKADAQSLAAGSYTVRLTGESLKPALGESPDRQQWVEFVQNGKVVGKAVATVVPPDEVREVGKADPPKQGQARVQMLKGNEYLRVWLSKDGTSYLIHMPTTGDKGTD